MTAFSQSKPLATFNCFTCLGNKLKVLVIARRPHHIAVCVYVCVCMCVYVCVCVCACVCVCVCSSPQSYDSEPQWEGTVPKSVGRLGFHIRDNYTRPFSS